MEKIERIQPFYLRNEEDYELLINFLNSILSNLNPNYTFVNNLFFQDFIDNPYVSSRLIKKIGTEKYGMEIIREKIYEQIADSIAVDRIIVRPYGLVDDLKIEIESTQSISDSPYLEIRIIGPNNVIEKIIDDFRFQFKQRPIEEEKLNRELVMLKTMIKRKIWYVVEMRAKNILEHYPNQIQALFAYAIARAAQNDLNSGEELLLKVLQQKPDHYDALFNLGVIYKQKEEYQKALEVLKKSLLINPQNHSVLSLLGEVKENLGEIKEALIAYQQASQYLPNPNSYGYIDTDFTNEIKEAIKRLSNFEKQF